MTTTVTIETHGHTVELVLVAPGAPSRTQVFNGRSVVYIHDGLSIASVREVKPEQAEDHQHG